MFSKKLFLIFAVCCFSASAFAQEHHPSLIRWQAEKLLSWDDFQGKADAQNEFAALARTGINFSYQASSREGALRLTFAVNAYFDKSQSWDKPGKQTAKLLAHEQIHFDIAEWHARKLKKLFETTKFTNNYKDEVKAIFTAAMADLKKVQHAYDAESDHSKNEEKQQAWELFVKNELSQYDQTSASIR